MSPSTNWMVALIALSMSLSSIGMSEEGYDSDVYEFNRANHLEHPASDTKRAFYFKPYQKKPHPIGSRPEGHEEYEPRPRPAHYKYRWKVEDDYSGNYFGHAESRDDTNTIGEYYVMLPDGRVQRVRYTVEGPYGGFKAVVSYEGKTKIAKPEKPRPSRPKNIFPAIRVRKPTYERASHRSVDPTPTYAVSTPGPSPESTLTPQFSHPRPTVVKFERESEPKWKRYSYRTLPDKIPDARPSERGGRDPSSALPRSTEEGPVVNEEKTADDSPALKTAAPPPTPFNFSYGPPGFQDPPPSRTSSNFDQDPPLNAVRRFTYRPVDAEVEDIEEEEEEDADTYYDDDQEGTNNIDDYREVLEPVVVGVPSTSSPTLHTRDPEVATLHYSLSSPYPPLHHSYVLQDHLYPLPSVKRYSYKEVPDEDGEEEEADAIADAEEDGADVPVEILDEGDGAESRDKVGGTGAGTKSEEETRVSRREERNEMNNDNIQMTIPEDLVLPESEVWGYRYLP